MNQIVHHYQSPPKHKRQILPDQNDGDHKNSNANHSIYNRLICCKSKLKTNKIEMDPILKYESKPNQHFVNLKIAIEFLETDKENKLSNDPEYKILKMNCCKFRKGKSEYWFIRYNDYCLISYMNIISGRKYPLDIDEFVDRNQQQIHDLFNFIKLNF